jgi:hypothetical protein
VTAALTFCLWRSLRGREEALRLTCTAVAVAPFALSLVQGDPSPAFFGTIWLLVAGSLVVSLTLRLSKSIKALWGACLALAIHGSTSPAARVPRLALAVIVGWGLSESGEAPAAWTGIELAGLAVWSYSVSGHSMSFAKISAIGAFAALGPGAPFWLATLLVSAGLVASAGAALLPRMARLEAGSLLADLPLFGALSAGSLFELWREKLSLLHAERLQSEDDLVARALWAAAAAWIFVLTRGGLAALDAVRGYRVRRTVSSSSSFSPEPTFLPPDTTNTLG